jgi:TP901 family phage tail tape measure protein
VSVIANVAINVDSRNAVSNLRQVQAQASATEKAFGALQSALGALGAGFALTKVIADVKELDTNLRRLSTVGVDVGKISPALSKLSAELGGVASKAELAAASYQAASAGFSDTAGNVNILRAATKAAVGGLADTQAVTEVLVKTLNSYGMSGSQAIQVTDSISKAVELGNQEWSDYTSQLGRVASIAALAGVSLDEVNTFIAAATKNGATAEIAFTGLGATLNTLLQPTKESQEAAAQLGIQWNYSGLQAKGFTGLMAELAVAIEKDKEASARLLGSQEAMRGAFAAASKNGADFKKILEQIGDASGKTDADFQTMKGSLENTLKALDTAFKNLSEALGKAFGPTLVIVIQDITRGVNGFASAMNAVPQPVLNAAGAAAKAVAQMLLLKKVIEGIIALRVGMAAMFAATATGAATAATAASGLTMNMRYLQGSMVAAKTQGLGLVGVLRSLAGFGIITVGINLAVTGLQQVIAANLEIARLRGERQAGGAAAIYQGSAPIESKQTAQSTLAAIQKERQRLNSAATIATGMLGPLAPLVGGMSPGARADRLGVLRERELRAAGTAALPTRTMPNAMGTRVGDIVGGGGAGGGGDAAAKKKGKTDAEREAERQKREAEKAAELIAQSGRELTTAQEAFKIEQRLITARKDGNKVLEATRQTQLDLLEINARGAEILTNKDLPEQAKLNEIGKLRYQAASASLNLQLQISELEKEQSEEAAKQLQAGQEKIQQLLDEEELLKAKLRGNEAEVILKQQLRDLTKEMTPEQIAQTEATVKSIEALKQQVAKAAELANLYEGITGQIAGGVGSAIDAVANGVDNLGESLKDIGQDILAAVGKMLIMYGIAQALGALGGSDGVGVFSALAKGFGFKGAKDGAYWPGGFQAFADGGVVTRPTMGLIGEGGEPEYVIPASKMRGAMSRYAAGTRGSAVIPAGGDGSEAGVAGAGGTATLDVRYTVERINSVDYVTADQFQAGMRQAASQGAERGQQLALRRLQQSPSTRRRLGL